MRRIVAINDEKHTSLNFVIQLILIYFFGNFRPNVQNSLFSFGYTNKVCASLKTHWTPVKHSTLSEKRTQAGLLARWLAVYMMLLLGCYLLGQGSAASAATAQPLKYRANDIHSLTALNLSVQKLSPNAAGTRLPEASTGSRAFCDQFQDIILLETSRAKHPCNRNGKADEMPGWHASSALTTLRLSRAPPVI